MGLLASRSSSVSFTALASVLAKSRLRRHPSGDSFVSSIASTLSRPNVSGDNSFVISPAPWGLDTLTLHFEVACCAGVVGSFASGLPGSWGDRCRSLTFGPSYVGPYPVAQRELRAMALVLDLVLRPVMLQCPGVGLCPILFGNSTRSDWHLRIERHGPWRHLRRRFPPAG